MSAPTQTSEFVADTVAMIIRLEGKRLGNRAKAIFDQVELGNTILYVPAMSLAEILYLSEKKRIGITLADVDAYFNQFPTCREYPTNFRVIEATSQITDIPELHDRLIAGTARYLNTELITNDHVIQLSAFVKTVWH